MKSVFAGKKDGDEDRSPEALARALRDAEADFERDRPETVVLLDDSDRALAAAIVATKLLIPVQATAAASEGPTTNARLIAQLASTYTEPE
jgi:hypothetical protein